VLTQILVFITSFLVVLVSTPSLIKVAKMKQLVDEPGDERKLHTRRVPTIGGIILFGATVFSFSLWFPNDYISDFEKLNSSVNVFKYLIATLTLLFFIGIKDDIVGTAAIKKLMANILVGLILVLMADIRLTSLHGIFGIREIPYWASVFLSLFTYIVIMNSINLIDGVDGLASGIGVIICLSFGLWFLIAGQLVMASLSFALGGSLLAFLIFNFSPAKIFMGDSGSLTIGIIVAIMTITLIEFNPSEIQGRILIGISKPVFAISVLIFPLFDTLRIFIYRAVRGVSPFEADRNHIHHRLLDLGFSHRQTVLILYAANVLIILLCIALKNFDSSASLIIVAGVSAILSQIPFFVNKHKKKKGKDKFSSAL